MTAFGEHLRQAWRTWRSAPGVAATAIVTMGFGLGVGVVALGLVESLVLRPLPAVASAEQVVVTPRNPFSYPSYRVFASRQRVFEQVAVFQQVSLNLATDLGAERVRGLVVSGNYFRTLGISAAAGRTLSPPDDTLDDRIPVVISATCWRARFAGAEDIVGRQIRLNQRFVTVVGVAPVGFAGTDLGYPVDVFVPIAAHDDLVRGTGGRPALEAESDQWLRAVARLRPGVTAASAQASAARLLAEMAAETPGYGTDELAFVPVHEAAFPGGSRRTATTGLLAVLAVAACVLLIACANVANLLLAHGESRRQEFGVRLALGASRFQVATQVLAETALLVACAAAAAVLAAQWAFAALASLPFTAHAPITLGGIVDHRVVGVTATLALVVTAACALAPALHAGRAHLRPSTGRTTTAGARRRLGGREALVAVQVAASVTLAVGAVVFLATLRNQEALPTGFESEGVAWARLHVGLAGHSPATGQEVFRQVIEQVQAAPAVEHASRAINTPLGAVAYVRVVARPGEAEARRVQNNVVSSGYFRTLGIPIVDGREFGDDSGEGAVIVNETLARTLWPGESAVGQAIESRDRGSRIVRVIGVAKDSKYETVRDGPTPFVYTHLADDYDARQVVFVRARGDAAALLPVLRDAVRRVDAGVPIIDLATLEDHVASTLAQPRAIARLVTAMAALATGLAAVGLYGLLSFVVSSRRRDLAIRIAIGASRARVAATVVERAAVAMLIGLAVGVPVAVGLGQWAATLFFGVRPADPWVIVTAAGLTLVVGGLAVVGPAVRAMQTPPAAALRTH